jgi:aminomethyltransferase
MSDLKHIPLEHLHTALGAKMVPFAGYLMPVRYTSDLDEHTCVRERCGIFDVSHMGEFLVEGPEALALIQKVVSNDASKLAVGQAQYAVLLREDGTSVDDLLIYYIEAEKYMLVVNASNIDKDFEHISAQNTMGASLKNISDGFCLFAVQGPKAAAALQSLTSVDLADIPYHHFKVGPMAGIEHIIISATGYTGSGGFELYVHNKNAEHLWNAVLAAGASEGMQPIGLGARDTLRLEMGYCLYGHELDDTTTPLEAGLGWATKLSKEVFLGKERLLAQKGAGVERKLTGFIVEGRGGIPRAGYVVEDGQGVEVGTVTSGTQSPQFGVGMGMAYLRTGSPTEGLQLAVRERKYPITLKKLPLTA